MSVSQTFSTKPAGATTAAPRNTAEQIAAQPADASQPSGEVIRPSDAMIQMISRTAHDLRAPLTTIRESVRLVRDGDIGRLSPSQNEFLSAAIDQCDCIDHMVEEMVQMQRLNSGFPRARRGWVSIRDIQAAVCDTLKPWTLPRSMHVLWDGPLDSSIKVFADRNMLRRLVVNLVTNAIRVTAEGDSVLVRLTRVHNGRAMRWSVVDQGSGISATDLEAIANNQAPTSSGSGLGLMISRQLAAVHFSSLWIESRINTGTVVSFETPLGGPSSVANAWVRWRQANQSADEMANRPIVKNFVRKRFASGTISPPRRVRFDVPTVLVELGSESEMTLTSRRIIAGSVSLGAATSQQAADRFDEVLQRHITAAELAYRLGKLHWVWVLDCDFDQVNERLSDIERYAKAEASDLRLTWGKAIDLGEMRDGLDVRLSDFLVRRTLDASKRHFNDTNQVRLGTTPIGESMIATRRLGMELERLQQRWPRIRA